MSKRKKPSDYVNVGQLLTKEGLLRYCRLDHRMTIRLDINMDFIEAAENEGFIKPIMTLRGFDKNEKGEEKEVPAPYYSPFQIYIITCFAKNKVVDGKLQSDENLDYQEQQKMRLLCWGWGGLKMNIAFHKENRRYHPEINDIYGFCDDFHKFLVFLHTFEAVKHDFRNRSKMRTFNDAPSISYDFSPIKEKGSKVLKPFGLSIDLLRMLRREIGQLAMQIDPLELWYPYINRHSRTKKDLLKGDAQLAQELYIIQDLIVEILESLYNTKEPDLLTVIYQDRPLPMFLDSREYLSGTDLKAMQRAIKNFKKWAQSKTNSKYVPEDLLVKLSGFESKLDVFEKIYGDKKYVSNITKPVEYEEKLSIKDLDPEVSKYVEQIMNQEGAKEHYKDEQEVKELIASAIDWRLSALKRELWSIFNEAREPLHKQVNDAWTELRNFGSYFWLNREKKLKELSRDEQRKIYRQEEQKARDKTQKMGMKRDELDEEIADLNLVYCFRCRKRPVPSHSSRGDSQASTIPLCDPCLEELNKGFLDFTEKEWAKVKEGEWRCMWCDERTLYKFAHSNVISLWTQNRVPIKLEMPYGKLILQAKCPKCKKLNEKEIDWGWGD